jgi:hypothetical protein
MQLVPSALSCAFCPCVFICLGRLLLPTDETFWAKRISPNFKIIPQLKFKGFWDVTPRRLFRVTFCTELSVSICRFRHSKKRPFWLLDESNTSLQRVGNYLRHDSLRTPKNSSAGSLWISQFTCSSKGQVLPENLRQWFSKEAHLLEQNVKGHYCGYKSLPEDNFCS